ncbi:hypothetical protein BY458DRAFT_504988 [Sporodiniella umbellata]|nr:hypothetical protein BY458DRAFT_504988 [Sporodiniella umbellata]
MSTAQLQRRLQFQKLYKAFLKSGCAAVEGASRNHKPQVKALIRQRFEKHRTCNDLPTLQAMKPKVLNTLEFLSLAASRNGIERNVVINLCSLKFYYDQYEVRPPHYNRKMKPEIKSLHENSKDEIELVLELMDKDLNLCLKL